MTLENRIKDLERELSINSFTENRRKRWRIGSWMITGGLLRVKLLNWRCSWRSTTLIWMRGMRWMGRIKILRIWFSCRRRIKLGSWLTRRGRKCRQLIDWGIRCWPKSTRWGPICYHLKKSSLILQLNWQFCRTISSQVSWNSSPNNPRNSYFKMSSWLRRSATFRRIWKFTRRFRRSWLSDRIIQGESSKN